jgi:hypothetical protein
MPQLLAKATEDYLPGAVSGAVFCCGLVGGEIAGKPVAKNCSAESTRQVVFSKRMTLA